MGFVYHLPDGQAAGGNVLDVAAMSGGVQARPGQCGGVQPRCGNDPVQLPVAVGRLDRDDHCPPWHQAACDLADGPLGSRGVVEAEGRDGQVA